MKAPTFPFLLMLGLLMATLATAAPHDGQLKTFVETRTQYQGRFAKIQQAIGENPAAATKEALADLAAFAKDLAKLRAQSIKPLNLRFRYWNNQAFWRGYWDKGPTARFVVEKFRAQIDATAALQLPDEEPFTKADLNLLQRNLDALRASYELDSQLQLLETQLLDPSRR